MRKYTKQEREALYENKNPGYLFVYYNTLLYNHNKMNKYSIVENN